MKECTPSLESFVLHLPCLNVSDIRLAGVGSDLHDRVVTHLTVAELLTNFCVVKPVVVKGILI